MDGDIKIRVFILEMEISDSLGTGRTFKKFKYIPYKISRKIKMKYFQISDM